ncbi:cilium assembly protein DZIP1L [Sabethes cyaneus]|uniref:cilium assembly protein DZIP1L n=1 Tax=Sabethes cyaneus TaxID=53552 RepID=UPI00237DB440|nr:cilium assembly protein DZIP1L [Sabethes cyaneus]
MAYKWNHNFPKIARDAGFIIREFSSGYCIDWRLISSIDPYAIVNERDYEKLDEFIPHISEVPIGTVLQNRILDPAIGKYFVLAQFSIQYLLFCKQFLDETIVELRNTAQDMQKENLRLEKNCRRKNEEIATLHRKLQRTESQVVYPCSKCTKNFISFELLNAHMTRKHTEMPSSFGDTNLANQRKFSETDTNLINTIKLELEVKQLKERLNIAEKGLIDQRNREHQCHGCSKQVKCDQEMVKVTPEFHTVAIQTNLDDRKDVNEKEVQTGRPKSLSPSQLSPLPRNQLQQLSASPTPLDVISKSDLEAILREQREQFECWKTAERRKVSLEIEQMRQSMAEAIREMEQRDRQPNSLLVPPVVTEERRASFEDEATAWKDRYHEMENMYQDSQRQVNQTVQNIESIYEKKFRQFEEMMQKHENCAQLKKLEQLPKMTAIAEVERDEVNEDKEIAVSFESTVPVIEVIEEKEESEIDDVIEQASFSDEVKDSESDEELKLLEAAKVKYLPKENESSLVKQKESPKKRVKPLMSPKKQVLNTFKSRLKGLGIDPKTKQLPTEDLRSATVALAERRDTNKKKNRGFFITRNQLSAKVDQIAKSKLIDSVKKLQKSPKHDDVPVIKQREASQSIPKIRSSLTTVDRKSSIDILPSKLKISTNDFLTIPAPSANPFKAKFIPVSTSSVVSVGQTEVQLTSDDIITVQAEINRIPPPSSLDRHETSSPVPAGRSSPHRPSSVSEYDQRLQRLLETPVKRLVTPPDRSQSTVQTAQLDGSDLSDLLEAVPQQPKPVPKKRVLFNLEDSEGKLDNVKHLLAAATVPVLAPTVTQESRADEESDWNISSFEDEK